MDLILVGLNHETAPVELRERFAFSEQEAEDFLAERLKDPAVEEAMLISTCNRTELLMRPADIPAEERVSFARKMVAWLISSKGVEAESSEAFHAWYNRDALRRLFRVSAGLESMVLGETQILAQMKDAFRTACRIRSNGFLVNKLMHFVFRVGKRARTETAIGHGSISVSLIAVELARKNFDDLASRRGLVIGAGEMGCLAAEHFTRKNIGSLTVVNRTYEKARQLVDSLGGETRAVPFTSLPEAVAEADMVVVSTSAPEPVLDASIMRDAMTKRRERHISVIDISMPRNVDPSVNGIRNVFAHDIDDLNRIVDGNINRRRAEIPAVETIIEEEFDSFLAWYKSLEITPTIKQLVERFETVRHDEVRKNLKHFNGDQRQQIDILTKSLVKKMLHGPITLLRESLHSGMNDSQLWVETMRRIYKLEQESDA